MKRIAKQYKMIDEERSIKKQENTKYNELQFVETETEKLMSRMQLVNMVWRLSESDKTIRAEIVGLQEANRKLKTWARLRNVAIVHKYEKKIADLTKG